MRAGVKIMSLSARGIAGIRDAFDVHCPDLVVLAGRHLGDETVARWTHSVRLAVGPMPIALYRRGDHLTDMPTTGTIVLPSRATDGIAACLSSPERRHGSGDPGVLANGKRLDAVVSPGPRATSSDAKQPRAWLASARCRCGSLARIRFRFEPGAASLM